MVLTRVKRLIIYTIFVVLLIAQTECKGRSSGGGSRSSSHSSSHSSSSHSSPSHSSSSGSHSFGSTSHSFGSGSHPSTFGGGSHTPFGGTSHTSSGSHPFGSNPGSGSHSSYPSSFGGGSSSGSHSVGSGPHSSYPSAPHIGPSAPHVPGYTVTGGAGFIPGGSKPIGFDHVNQQAHNTPLNSAKPLGTSIHTGPPGYTVTGGAAIPNKPAGIGFDHVNQQVHNTQLNNGKPLTPPVSGGIGAPQHVNPVHSAPPGYTVTGGSPILNKPPVPIGFDHVNQQAHNGGNNGRPISSGVITPQHSNPVHSNSPGSGFASHPQPNYPANTGSRPGIGFDHVNQQAAGVHHTAPAYQPYRPQTIVQPSGYVHYQPPTQLQYAPPPVTVHHTTTHYVPVYQPSVIHTYSSGSSGGSVLSHGGAFLGGYLVGRLSGSNHDYHNHGYGYHDTHITNNYYNGERRDNGFNSGNNWGSSSGPSGSGSGGDGGNTYNSYYNVHHYYQNREQVPSKFSVPGEDLTQCQANVTDHLCVPNTSAFCLKNGTIMCTTPTVLTTPCGMNSTERCVYSRIDCLGNPACNVTANQTYIDFYLPCIANVTYLDNKVLDSTSYKAQGSYELCVTALAQPKKLESPVSALANLFSEFGKWHLEQFRELSSKKENSKR